MTHPPFDQATRRAIISIARGGGSPRMLRDPRALHVAANMWDWDCQEPGDLVELARHPSLGRGTLLMLYWRSAPRYFCQYSTEADVPDAEREGYDLTKAFEALYLERTDLADGIAFDPGSNEGGDSTADYADLPQHFPIPPEMRNPVAGETLTDDVAIDQLTRDPTPDEHATIAAAIARARALLPTLSPDAPPRTVIAAIADALRHPPESADDLAWLWLDQLPWPWRCGDSATDGTLFGKQQEDLVVYPPDIVRVTLDAGIDPAETLAFFDLLALFPHGLPEHAIYDRAALAFDRGWLVSVI